MTDPVGLVCPGCGRPPVVVLPGGRQAFCGTEDCPWVCWDPTETLAEINATATTVDLSPLADLIAPKIPPEDENDRSP